MNSRRIGGYLTAVLLLGGCSGRESREFTAADSRAIGDDLPEIVLEADVVATATNTTTPAATTPTSSTPQTTLAPSTTPSVVPASPKPVPTTAPPVATVRVRVRVPVPVPLPVPVPFPATTAPARPPTTPSPTTTMATTPADPVPAETTASAAPALASGEAVVNSTNTSLTQPKTPKRRTTTTRPVPMRPRVNGACARTQRRSSKLRNDGSLVTCAQNAKRVWVWQLVESAPTAPHAAPTVGVTSGFNGSTIRVGVLTTTTNPTWGQIGKALFAGMEARVAAINKKGGIAGRYRVELVMSDTNYDAAQTLTKLNETQNGVVGYMSILGTPNVEAVEPTLRNLQILAGPASQEARWAKAPNLLPIANSYQVQAINGISYFLETNANPKATVCGLSVATSYGEAGSEGIRFAQSKLGFTAGPIASIGPVDTNVAPALNAMKSAGCAAVFLTTTPQQTAAAVITGRAIAFAPRWIIMGASFSDRIVVPQTGPLFEQGAWVVGDGTAWGDPTVPGMAQLASELIGSNNRYWTENPDVGLTYGWTQAKVFEAVLERAVVRGDLSHAGLVAASREIGVVDAAGLFSPVDYSATVRLADARTTIFNVDGSYRNAIRVLSPAYTSDAAMAYRPV